MPEQKSLQSVDRMRRRFDDAVAELGELEIENSLTNQEVLEVIQRGELLTRLAKQVRTEALKLGGEAGLILIQLLLNFLILFFLFCYLNFSS